MPKPSRTLVPELGAAVARYHRPLLRHLRGKVASDSDAEDIAQEVWLRAAQPPAEAGSAIDNVRAWLYRVARNLVVDHHRQTARRGETVLDDAAAAALPDGRPDPERALLTRGELRRAAAAIRAMPARPRQIFRLSRIEGLSLAEIGRRLGITRQSAHDHMVRALLLLQNAMDDGEDREG